MHRASAYERSQNTLINFASIFNTISTNPNLYCCPIIKETMLNDGCFVDVGVGKLFTFDWEIRLRLDSFAPGEFKYKTLTEFDRKFSPDKKTQLFIQCDNQEKHIAVAWREDFKESGEYIVKADYGQQRAKRRETTHFKVFALDDLTEFKDMLSKAFESTTYNHTIF